MATENFPTGENNMPSTEVIYEYNENIKLRFPQTPHEFSAAETASLMSLSAGAEATLRLMSDCEERDFICKSWMSPLKTKRKKNFHKDKNCVKHKNIITMKTEERIQKKKKKKKSKFTEAMEGRKEKRKEKKGKKNKLSVGSDESFILTQGYSGASCPFAKSKTKSSHPCSSEKLKPDDLTQDPKKTKRKKKVVWDLSPGYIRVKRPKFASSSPRENILSDKEAVRDGESCSEVTVTSQPHDSDSQCTGDDINSQDLFITQKTFRASPSEPSSGEASDKSVFTTPQPVTPRERRLHSSGVQIKQHEESNIHLQQSHFYQQPKKAKDHLERPKTVRIVPIEDEEGLHLAQQNPKKETLSFQRQMDLNTNLTEEGKVSGPRHVKPSVVNPYLDEPVVVNPSPHVAKSKKRSCSSGQQSPSRNTGEPFLLPRISKASISTQTENFFTTELSSYLNFCQKSGVAVCFESLKPLDLSLPERARKDLGRCLSVNVPPTEIKDDEEKRSDQKPSSVPDKMKDNSQKDPSLRPSCPSELIAVEVKNEPSGWQQWSLSAQGKGKTTSSPKSESGVKSVYTTTSSEDSEPPCCTGKPDLTQVRAVQMRLNESFFFKTKGEGRSLRPESPLMKLAQGREMKSRKGH
ncbi:uncharacterized protein [Trachinotus anak]|uniref:uncharacterized protein n=1 Tax=Trachinotus anak TaxID=443729 RepID=UPI0039F1FD55